MMKYLKTKSRAASAAKLIMTDRVATEEAISELKEQLQLKCVGR